LALFVNRKAYTRQSANLRPETGRHYHYQPKNKDSGQPPELDPATVHKRLAGWITAGRYAINPQSQRCEWIGISSGTKLHLTQSNDQHEIDKAKSLMRFHMP
jgi:hypothetical protein